MLKARGISIGSQTGYLLTGLALRIEDMGVFYEICSVLCCVLCEIFDREFWFDKKKKET